MWIRLSYTRRSCIFCSLQCLLESNVTLVTVLEYPSWILSSEFSKDMTRWSDISPFTLRSYKSSSQNWTEQLPSKTRMHQSQCVQLNRWSQHARMTWSEFQKLLVEFSTWLNTRHELRLNLSPMEEALLLPRTHKLYLPPYIILWNIIVNCC